MPGIRLVFTEGIFRVTFLLGEYYLQAFHLIQQWLLVKRQFDPKFTQAFAQDPNDLAIACKVIVDGYFQFIYLRSFQYAGDSLQKIVEMDLCEVILPKV